MPDVMHQLVSPGLLRTLMQRTGTGARVTVRELAAAAGVPHGTIGNLLTGEQLSVPYSTAHAVAQRIGVDVLILFIPMGRATAATVRKVVPSEQVSA